MKYRLTQDIVIPKGSEVFFAAIKTERFVPFAEVTLAHGKDSCSDWTIPLQEALELGLIEEIQGNV